MSQAESQKRKHVNADQKVAILRRYLVEKTPISDLCDEYGIQPSQVYQWQKVLFENGPAAFERTNRGAEDAQERKVAALEAKVQQKNEERGHRRVDAGARPVKKSHWGPLRGRWVPHDARDEIVDYVRRWSERTELPGKTLVGWIGIGASKFHNWQQRYGKLNEHNAWVPRDWWLEEWEKQAILDFQRQFPLEGYRRMTFMMLDRDVAAASPTTVYRVLKAAGRMTRFAAKPSQKGKGFTQPLQPGPPSQRLGLHHAGRQVGWAGAGDFPCA
jgi:transposase-like protein